MAEPPFTESELLAARMRNGAADFAAAMQRFSEALRQSLELESVRLAAARKAAQERAAERQKRIEQAQAWLREQEATPERGAHADKIPDGTLRP